METQAVPQIVLQYISLGYIQFLPTKGIFIMTLNNRVYCKGLANTVNYIDF